MKAIQTLTLVVALLAAVAIAVHKSFHEIPEPKPAAMALPPAEPDIKLSVTTDDLRVVARHYTSTAIECLSLRGVRDDQWVCFDGAGCISVGDLKAAIQEAR